MATYSNNTTIKIQGSINVSTTTNATLFTNGGLDYADVSIFVIANAVINGGNEGSLSLSLSGVPFFTDTSISPAGTLLTVGTSNTGGNSSSTWDAGTIIHKIDLKIGPGQSLTTSSQNARIKVVVIGTYFRNTP